MPQVNTYKGTYVVENKDKYLGNKNPSYRSSWESRFCYYLDHDSSVKKWGYECLEIPYFNAIDKKVHRYYPDFYFEEIDKDGKARKFVIEVKPSNQTQPPQQPKNNNGKANKRYVYEAYAFVKNQCKWEAAKKFCQDKGFEFMVITEKELFSR